jgi:serine/threonine protein kinase
MSTKIGHFEILSELAKSATGAVYKANDPESGQTVALKAIQLAAFGEKAAALQQALTEEAESTKSLTSSNITPIFGAGEMDGQFCIAMEYVQGNSIATMLARKEGFSIWDLLDIGRQVCSGLDQAHAAQVHHHSLEPAKIMCAWDGSIKILSMGASSVGKFVSDMPGETPSILHYMSPEQVLGDQIDGRSNLFSLGAMFYEMVTDRKAFEGVDVESVRQRILDSTPTPPVKVNAKLHPLLSDLIMKALSKDPAERYQNGRELLDSLEKCKESKPQAANKLAPKPLSAVVKPPAAAKAVPPAPAAPARTVAPPAPRLRASLRQSRSRPKNLLCLRHPLLGFRLSGRTRFRLRLRQSHLPRRKRQRQQLRDGERTPLRIPPRRDSIPRASRRHPSRR